MRLRYLTRRRRGEILQVPGANHWRSKPWMTEWHLHEPEMKFVLDFGRVSRRRTRRKTNFAHKPLAIPHHWCMVCLSDS
jgi:hypothetical protein